jgi:excisionase family DNA binding protein
MNYLPTCSTDNPANGGAMSVDELCRWSGVGKTKIYAEAKSGRLKMRKIGARTLILRTEAEDWLRSLPSASAI